MRPVGRDFGRQATHSAPGGLNGFDFGTGGTEIAPNKSAARAGEQRTEPAIWGWIVLAEPLGKLQTAAIGGVVADSAGTALATDTNR